MSTTQQYTIEPTLEGTASAATVVLGLFGAYLALISYLATYDISYYPNFNMFINFIFDNYDGLDNFNKYIHNVAEETSQGMQNMNESMETISKQDPIANSFTQLSSFYHLLRTTIYRFYQSILMPFYIHGTTFKIHKS